MIKLYMEAETNQSSILVDKTDINSCFNEYLKGQIGAEQSDMNEERWHQVSEEADKYNPLPDRAVKISVLTEKEFSLLLNQKGISKKDIGTDKEKCCIVFLPDFSLKISGNKEIIQIGGIRKAETGFKFYKEKFRALLWNADNEEDNIIQVVLKEDIAKKSKLILGYDKINITVRADVQLSVQREIDTKVSLIMSSIQGGMLESSVIRNEENKLMGNYTSILSNSMILFSIITICLYIILSSYIDWEKHKHEYAILRSFGMGYNRLWRKIFFRYISSIAIACIVLVPVIRGAFSTETLNNVQVLISIVINLTITCLCGSIVYYWHKSKSIVSMLN